MRVLTLALNGSGEASTRYRFCQYTPELGRRGHVHALSSFYLELPSARRSRFEKLSSWALGLVRQAAACLGARRFDVVVVQRFICPYVLNELVRVIRAPIIYDFDDAVWLAEPPRLLPLDAAHTFAELCACARVVSAGNAFLAEHARAHARDVRVVPTVVDTERFAPRPRGAKPVIGWVGSPSTFHFLQPVLPALDALARERHFRLRVVGAPRRLRLPHLEVEQPDWREEDEARYFGDLDIGLYPLSDDAWSRGKCGLKSIQYMSSGVAQVTSPVGVAKEIARGAALFVEQEWAEPLRRLLDDAALRAALAVAGRERAVKDYALATWQRRVASLYEEVVKP